MTITVKNTQKYKTSQRLNSGGCRFQVADFQSLDHPEHKINSKKAIITVTEDINKLEEKKNGETNK